MVRQRTLLLISLLCLATLWSCRLPKMCLYSQCREDVTAPSPQSVDLSRADSPFISWPLERVCRETTTWHPGVTFVCDNNSGGIGNIRNYILTCLRYAIEAGVTAIVLPEIRTRADDNLASIMNPHRPFTYFFDEAHFRRALRISCPQITIYSTTDDIPHAPVPFKAEEFTPRNLGSRGGCDRRDLNRHTDRFGKQFVSLLERTATEYHLPAPSTEHPRIFRFTWGVQWDIPVFRDGPEFVATFGGILKFRDDILDLGRRVTKHMRGLAGKHASSSFAGMHLRTENDALSAWPRYENQSRAYLSRAADMGFRVAYLATGNRTEADKLAGSARAEYGGMEVVTKHQVLKNYKEDLEVLEALTWDQQALVDFVALLESDYFFGVSPSSFSMNVALKRHLKTGGLYTRPWKIGGDGDGYSWLVGRYEKYWDDWLFMYDSLWP